MLILDASVTLAWGLPDEQSEYADAVLAHVAGGRAYVPAIWVLEVLNAVLSAERSKRFSPADGKAFLAQLGRLHRRRRVIVASLSPAQAFDDQAVLARDQRTTAYDAAYLHLARAERLPLASIDNRLNKAAAKLGIPRWTPTRRS